MLGKIKHLTEVGDTIVEVMIVLAVLGLAIGISYATANRSLLNARQAQENAEATALVQSQVEALRTLAPTVNVLDATHYIYRSGSFCISQSAPYRIVTGSACTIGTIPYNLRINYAGATTDTFTVTASWNDVSGRGTDTVTTVYRAHKP